MLHKLQWIGLSILIISATLVFLGGCATVPAGSPETGYAIHGFVGKTWDTAAPGESVVLLNGDTDQALASTQANLLGQYSFAGLQPGHYKVKVLDKVLEVVLMGENLRLDVNLSSDSGAMNYAENAVGDLTKILTGAVTGTAPMGPNDPELAKQLTGIWWGYSGSTETKIGLCPGGRFHDYTESGYSGTSYDSGGNETMNWGSANQSGGQGTWSVQGTAQSGTIQVNYSDGTSRTIQYSSDGDQGCLLFDGAKLCWSEGC